MTISIAPGIWQLDPTDTTVTFSVKNMLVRTVTGSFAVSEGTATVTPDHNGSRIAVSVDATSFDTGNPKRDDHVRSDDFFHVEEHPVIRFESSRIRTTPSGFEIDGTLHARENAETTFTVSDLRTDGDDVRFVATAEVDRASIGAGKMPSLMIGKTATVTVAGRATKR